MTDLVTMTDLLDLVIDALRTRCAATFANPDAGVPNVAGAAEFEVAFEATSIPLPFAFVIPLDDNPDPSLAINAVYQRLEDNFAVVVAMDNTVDEKGQTGMRSTRQMRARLWKALLGWQPADDGEKSIYNGIEYQGGALLKIDRGRLWYQFEFSAPMEILPEDGYQPGYLESLPHLDGVSVNVDGINPEADPNLQRPGPDGRIEHVVPVPKSGNLP